MTVTRNGDHAMKQRLLHKLVTVLRSSDGDGKRRPGHDIAIVRRAVRILRRSNGAKSNNYSTKQAMVRKVVTIPRSR
ncbi:hypothetical protein NPIL_429211 [Nephila pilipes]|uniref:Uncharacterized protein n=1 Tax=Nephila pilipes TaxID=299642 RepID=A0A8X6Q5Y0_NEPPI|nr:hypothetical protein NPIL_429211 [Nephila pilipes]